MLGAAVAFITMARHQDWLISPDSFKAQATISSDSLKLTNGIVSRTWYRDGGGIGCYSLRCETTGEEFIRSIEPEGLISLNDQKYDIGGLAGQRVHNFVLPEWLAGLKPNPNAFQLIRVRKQAIQTRFNVQFHPEWMGSKVEWPPKGIDVVMTFSGPPKTGAEGVTIDVHTELYDGLPLFGKWFELKAGSSEVKIDTFSSERLACVEGESSVDAHPNLRLPNLHVETDFTTSATTMRPTAQWLTDPTYGTQVNYDLKTPCLLDVSPPLGPAKQLRAHESFTSFNTWLMPFDSTEETRKTLALCKMYRATAPWVTENPLIFHCARSDTAYVKGAIDQAANAGFELVIMTFGSGYNVEDESTQNLTRMKELADYARSKGIALGGYSLLASRSIDAENDVINPKTGKPGGFATFGNSPCLGSKWGVDYFRKLQKFYDQTGMTVLEHDGSYPGDPCASTAHPGHTGYDDSRWNQWETIRNFYAWCRSKGIYLNVPDWYFMNGSNKDGMGYRETNWSLPRAQQEIIERQNIFDGTRTKAPTMGWMFVPLMEYQGGGAEAVIEPLKDHLGHYERRLQNLLGAGVQACFRGPRLYDAPETEAMVKKWVSWYKKHREILDSDIVPLRRPDGRDWDGLVHVNPRAKECALAVVYNPLREPIKRKLSIPLYFSGLSGSASYRLNDGPRRTVSLDATAKAQVTVEIPAAGFVWISIGK